MGLAGGQVPPIELRHIVSRNLRVQGVFVGSQSQTNELFVLVAEKHVSSMTTFLSLLYILS